MPDREEGDNGSFAHSEGREQLSSIIAPLGHVRLDGIRSALERIVENEVLPQLIIGDRRALETGLQVAGADVTPSGEDVDRFQFMVVHNGTAECLAFVDALRERGISLNQIFLGLFAPVAEELGRKWSTDELSFVDVTLGVKRMQALMRPLAGSAEPVAVLDDAHRILLATSAAEQHSLGMYILAETFKQEGWTVTGGGDHQVGQKLISTVHDRWFGVVGLSAATREHAIMLKSAIDGIRSESRNRDISILVGGRGFLEEPDLAREVGADGFASDAEKAVGLAFRLLDGD